MTHSEHKTLGSTAKTSQNLPWKEISWFMAVEAFEKKASSFRALLCIGKHFKKWLRGETGLSFHVSEKEEIKGKYEKSST